MAEGLDSIMTLLRVIIFATNCKSSGGRQLEEASDFKAVSISDRSATISDQYSITVKYQLFGFVCPGTRYARNNLM
jgi:predicted GNAT family N-acyltransferase